MDSKAEKLELEQNVCELQRKLAESEKLQEQKEVSLKYALEELEVAEQRLRHNKNNLKHMRQQEDFVDFREYKGVRRLATSAFGEFVTTGNKVRLLRTEIENYKALVKDLERAIRFTKNKLAQFGRIISWRSRD